MPAAAAPPGPRPRRYVLQATLFIDVFDVPGIKLTNYSAMVTMTMMMMMMLTMMTIIF
jgi:hypothetical protein